MKKKLTPSGKEYDSFLNSTDVSYLQNRCKQIQNYENVEDAWLELDKFGSLTIFIKYI